MNDFYMCFNVNQDEMYMFLFIENTDEWGWLTPIPIFSIESSKSFTLFLVNFLQILWYKQPLKQRFTHLFIFSEYYTWDFRVFLVGSVSVLWNNLLILTQYTCRIKESSSFLATLPGSSFNFIVQIP